MYKPLLFLNCLLFADICYTSMIEWILSREKVNINIHVQNALIIQKMYVIIIKQMITFKDKKNNNSGKSKYKYSCECCHYNTSDKYDYNTHLLTLTTNILHL